MGGDPTGKSGQVTRRAVPWGLGRCCAVDRVVALRLLAALLLFDELVAQREEALCGGVPPGFEDRVADPDALRVGKAVAAEAQAAVREAARDDGDAQGGVREGEPLNGGRRPKDKGGQAMRPALLLQLRSVQSDISEWAPIEGWRRA